MVAGESRPKVTEIFYIYLNTVLNIIKRYKEQNNTLSRPRKGGPRVLLARDKRLILRIIRKELKITYNTLLLEYGLPVSKSTIVRILKSYYI